MRAQLILGELIKEGDIILGHVEKIDGTMMLRVPSSDVCIMIHQRKYYQIVPQKQKPRYKCKNIMLLQKGDEFYHRGRKFTAVGYDAETRHQPSGVRARKEGETFDNVFYYKAIVWVKYEQTN